MLGRVFATRMQNSRERPGVISISSTDFKFVPTFTTPFEPIKVEKEKKERKKRKKQSVLTTQERHYFRFKKKKKKKEISIL